MKTHTNAFKENISLFGRELDSIITYVSGGTTITLDNENLNLVTPHYEGGILKSVMKQLDIDCDREIPIGTQVNYRFGVKVGESEGNAVYDYISYGNYIVYSVEKQEDTNSWLMVCYDKMLYAMKDYERMNMTYPITIRDYISTICTRLGLVFKNANSTFANYNKEIPYEMYISSDGDSLGYTFRDVLDELAQVTASTICINEDDDQLEIRYINDTQDTIDEEYLKDINVNFGEKYGPVNSLILSRSADSDFTTPLDDDESINENGLCQIKISNNQILNWEDRETYMQDIFDVLDGLEFYLNDFSSTGIAYYNLCDRYNIEIGENTYSCVMLNDEVNITQGLEESVHTDIPEENVDDYKNKDKTERRIDQAYLMVDKQNGTIEGLIRDQDETNERLSQTIQDVQSIQSLFQITGGTNLIKNSQFLLTDEVWDIDDEDGYVTPLGQGYNSNLIGQTTSIANIKMKNASINTKTMNITGLKVGQQYTLNYYYTLDSNTTGIITLKGTNSGNIIDSKTYNTNQSSLKREIITFTAYETNYTIQISTTTTLDGYFTIYDLMLNSGDVKNWEPSVSEIYSTILKMSQLGLQVYASGSGTITLLNSEGLNIYKSNSGEIGQIVDKFTNEGIEVTGSIKVTERIKNGTWVEKDITINSNNHHIEYMEVD